jgi:hypothetical protein
MKASAPLGMNRRVAVQTGAGSVEPRLNPRSVSTDSGLDV